MSNGFPKLIKTGIISYDIKLKIGSYRLPTHRRGAHRFFEGSFLKGNLKFGLNFEKDHNVPQ